MNKKYIGKNANQHITGRYMLRRLTAARATKNRSRASALCAVFLRHIWGRGHCYAMPYYLPQTSYTAGTLYAIVPKRDLTSMNKGINE